MQDIDQPAVRSISGPPKHTKRQRGPHIAKATSTPIPAAAFEYRLSTNSVDIPEAPKHYWEATQGEHSDGWVASMKREYQSLIDMKTWTLVDLPPGCKSAGSKWAFRVKLNFEGGLSKLKSRGVVKGYSQIYGDNFWETTAPTAKSVSNRFIYVLAAQHGYVLKSLDIETAYLNALLDVVIYMDQLPGTFEVGDRRVCALRRALYGTKQGGRCWYLLLRDYMIKIGFEAFSADPSVYFRNIGKERIIVSISTDDLLYMSSSGAISDEFEKDMEARFKMTRQGELRQHLGVTLTRSIEEKYILMSQEVYTVNMLKRFGFQDCKPCPTPMQEDIMSQFGPVDKGTPHTDMIGIPYHQAIGALMWLAVTSRADISLPVGILGAYVNNPKPEHWNAVKRIFRYLKGTSSFVLRIGGYHSTTSHDPVIEAYSDADHAGDRSTRRSRSGGVIQYNGTTVIYFSRKQKHVTISSTDAERVGAHEIVLDIAWTRKLLADFQLTQKLPTIHRIDNMATISQVNNEGESAGEKHMDVKYHYMKEMVQDKKVFPKYISTDDNLADIFTKPLPYEKFIKFRRQLGVLDPNEYLGSSWSVVGSDPRHGIPFGGHDQKRGDNT
jgi:hypothetical protein